MLNRIPGAKNIPILKHLTSPQKMAYIQYNYGGTMTSYVTKLTNRVFRSGVIPGIDKKAVVGTSLDFDIDVTNPKKLYKAFTEGEGLANSETCYRIQKRVANGSRTYSMCNKNLIVL